MDGFFGKPVASDRSKKDAKTGQFDAWRSPGQVLLDEPRLKRKGPSQKTRAFLEVAAGGPSAGPAPR
jgi:hypothetical protein